MSTPPARILLVDDHPMVRERLAQVIDAEQDLKVCGQAEDRAEALQLVESTHPDLVITDLQLKNSHGLELIRDLRMQHPKLAVLVVSMFDSSVYVERSIRAGARGYVTKQQATRIIVQAIRSVLAGETYMSDEFARSLATRVSGGAQENRPAGMDSLANREFQVFEFIGHGLTTRQIADRMRLDESTVDTYRQRIREKLKLRDPGELLQIAIAWVHSTPRPTD